jgi:type II secretory pathway component PulM
MAVFTVLSIDLTSDDPPEVIEAAEAAACTDYTADNEYDMIEEIAAAQGMTVTRIEYSDEPGGVMELWL